MDKLHIVTVATDSKYYFPYLIRSCKRNGKELEVLGFGEKWQGFTWRYELMIEYLKSIPENDIVCFIDGYDVVCTRDLNELKEAFIKIKNQNNCKIIVGNDKIQNNFLFKFFHNIFFGKCNNISINAGTYIGYSKDILYILEKINSNKNEDDKDDQILLTNYCINNPNDIYIDIDSKLFLTMLYPLTDLDKHVEIKNNKLIYNNNKPFFIHAAGHGFLDNILIKLNYNYNDNIKKEYYNEILKKIPHYIKNFIKNNKILSLLIIIILLSFIIGLYYLIKYIYNFFIKNKKYKKSSKA